MKGVTIVVRHIKDFDKGQTDTSKEFGTRYIWDHNGTPGRSINLWTDKGTGSTGLTTCPHGYRQARRYKEKLPQILKDKGWSEIRHIHVHDPQPIGTTCNPFESVFPLIRSDINSSKFTPEARNLFEKPTNSASSSTITDVNLYPLSGNNYGGLKDRMTPDLVSVIKNINPDKPREHSTLFCGTRDTLWGPKPKPKPACDDEEDEKAKKKDAEIQKGTLLYELAKQYGFDEGEITNRITEKPEKGNSVYIFHGKGKLS
jgi:hypothetical protein